MANRLLDSSSPYLIQHAHNPVDWYPWGKEALDRARLEDKPIFLSIGYAACHWCHVMAHETFEDPEVAAYLREHYIAIKVDREERPDLDSIYMNAVVALTGQGGWPLSVFLSSEGKPFYGGTYYPPVPRYNIPSFRQVISQLADIWEHNREKIDQVSRELSEQIGQQMHWSASAKPISPETLEKATQSLLDHYDWKNGGWGGAPKFPQPMVIDFLLRTAVQGNDQPLAAARHTLQAMSRGGMYDLVGGGFHRYSTDEHWHIPHYEKMLYDNAQLALSYLHGYLLTAERSWKQVCENTLDFILRELSGPEGGFYSSLDADSDGGEGAYYTWTRAELNQVLGQSETTAFFFAAHGIDPNTAADEPITLRQAMDSEALAATFGLSPEAVQEKLAVCYERLHKHRQSRPRPGLDDKVLAAWNALALRAFSEAASYLKRSDYLAAARKNADFLINTLFSGPALLRCWRQGVPGPQAYLEDYAGLILGLLSMYQSDPNPRWFSTAQRLCGEMLAHFQDPEGGFFDTRDDHESLLLRPKELQDNATPSGNALAAAALIQMAAFTGETDLLNPIQGMLETIPDLVSRYPTAGGYWLTALDLYLRPVIQVAIMTSPGEPAENSIVEVFWKEYRPQCILAVAPFPPADESPALLLERPLLAGKTTAYVCEGFQCQRPVTTAEELSQQLGSY